MPLTHDDVLQTMSAKHLAGEFVAMRDNLDGEKALWHVPNASGDGHAVYVRVEAFTLDTDGVEIEGVDYDDTHLPRTSLRFKDKSSLNSNVSLFIVVPGGDWRSKHNIDLGDVGYVLFDGILVPVIVGDVGPKHRIGEGSIALHRTCGQERIRNGRIDDKTLYPTDPSNPPRMLLFPNSGTSYALSNSEVAKRAEAAFRQFAGLEAEEKTSTEEDSADVSTLDDATPHPEFAEAWQWARTNKIVLSSKPDDQWTAEQVVAVLHRALGSG